MFNVDVRDTDADEVSRLRPRPPFRQLHPTKLAAIDLGSNSFHLIAAVLTDDGRFTTVARAKEKVQLGESAFQSGRISAQGFERGLGAVRRLRDVLREQAPDEVIAVATAAVREASNGREFARCASRILGLPIHVIDGLEEARLVCLGTRQGLTLAGRRIAMIDFGGGSTEVVLADDHGCLLTASLPLGALRLGAQWSCQDPPTATDLLLIENRVADAIKPTIPHVRGLGFDRVVFSCGAARKLLRMAAADPIAGLDATTAPWATEPALSVQTLQHLERRLAGLDARRRAAFTGATAGQIDTFLPAAIALRVILERIGAESALVSSTGLREGIVADYIAKSTATPVASIRGR
jgi:exopolyphosphatase/guanosine-5'-triphosphate,3'-diphosphate pyrophosphatase